MPKQLEVFRSLGETVSIGWKRDDVPRIHVFGQGKEGEYFQPASGPEGGPHWPCVVCDHHGYTEADFHEQLTRLLKASGQIDGVEA